MTIFNCTFVSVEARKIPAFLSEYIHSITNWSNGLLFFGVMLQPLNLQVFIFPEAGLLSGRLITIIFIL